MSFMMYAPTLVLFGNKQLDNLHKQMLPGKKALIVISSGKSVRENGYLSRLEGELQQAGKEYVVFDKIKQNPDKNQIMEGAKCARDNSCDFILALGGGSCIDASKAISLMSTNEGDIWDYVTTGTGGGKAVKNKPLPIVAITTTAGTGSEADCGGVVTNPETNEKTGVVNIQLFPAISIVDPELMKSVPPRYTAYQGFDAFFHSAEGYISKRANKMSDMVGINAIENVARFLPRAVADGNDMEARENVAFGSYLSGIEMCVGSTSSQHSLEHAMSAYHSDLPHGAGLIMLSKEFFSHFIEAHVCDDRFIRMAKAMGKEDASRAEDFIEMLEKLQQECGVNDLKMSDYGITPDEFPKMAKNARETMPSQFLCDRKPLTDEDIISIYQKSYK